MSLAIDSFHDPATGTVTHLLHDTATRRAAVVDPVLDFDIRSGRTATRSAQRVVDAVRAQDLRVDWILETHVHADHLSGAQWLRAALGPTPDGAPIPIAIGARVREVQATFKHLLHLEPSFAADAHEFDRLLEDGDVLHVGTLAVTALWVPGHTPADLAFAVADAVFVGDTLFMPDVGTARADFPGGDARVLYRSIRRLLALPPDTRLFVCHDYPPAGRAVAWQATVAEQRAGNVHVHDGVDEAAFVAMREARDATLDVPALILPSIQVNVRAGAMPPPGPDGVSYLRIPVDAFPPGR